MSLEMTLLRTMFRGMNRMAPAAGALLAERLFLTPRIRPLGNEARQLMSEGERFRVPMRGFQLAGWSWGQGPTVLMVHGWTGRATSMAPLIRPLVDAGYRVMAYDGPAHGESTGRRAQLTLWADAILAVAKHVGEPYAVIAHSMGCAGTTLALGAGLGARRAVYLAPLGNIIEMSERFAGMLAISPKVIERMRANMCERYRESWVRYGGDWPSLLGPSIAPRLRTPLLVLHDAEDREVDWRQADALVRAWPGAELVTTRGLGHTRICASPEVVERVLSFLGPADVSRLAACP
ncbi:alpha/beta hydrolase [Archangium sp.]|uniref:alpha/beta hydrolase n=1 Tax=Archangium sp. TaxID=1872627 RepID=UPI002D24E259|nr:alpha/beta fold hydrolase [Archangium sp.]HYO52969.1 alpha/beta fold hydrolase [Archangium sp.]